jgi:3-deoxy-D-manno-octulosonic acid kinase
VTSLDGFSRIVVADGELWLGEGFEGAAEEFGLRERSRWDALIAAGVAGGRGKIAFVERSGRYVALKQLRRGGLAGPIWRQRFLTRGRLTENLSIPKLARERGVATPAALALLVVPGPPGLWRGWLAIETVPAARDMRQRVLELAPTPAEWAEALCAARKLHDAGIEHPDLNLGNLLIDERGRGWVVDLDGCTVHVAALDVDRRIDAIRRIERSYLKTCFLSDVAADAAIDWPALYARADQGLAACWDQRKRRDVAKLNRHRRSWRR